MPGRGWTPLFFPDEAVALAAGQRPCAWCWRSTHLGFRMASVPATGVAMSAREMDAILHAARITVDRRQARHKAPLERQPDRAFALRDGAVWLVRGDRLLPSARSGYGAAAVTRDKGPLTPPPSLAARRGLPGRGASERMSAGPPAINPGLTAMGEGHGPWVAW